MVLNGYRPHNCDQPTIQKLNTHIGCVSIAYGGPNERRWRETCTHTHRLWRSYRTQVAKTCTHAWQNGLQRSVRRGVAKQAAWGLQCRNSPLQLGFVLVDVMFTTRTCLRPSVLSSPPHRPRPQQQERPDGVISRLTEVTRHDLLAHRCRAPHHAVVVFTTDLDMQEICGGVANPEVLVMP